MTRNEWRSPTGAYGATLRCRHEDTSTEDVLRASDWSATAETRRRAFVLEGVRVERCSGCGAVRVRPPATDEAVEQAFRSLARLGHDAVRAVRPLAAAPAASSPLALAERPSDPGASWRARAPVLQLPDVVLPAVTRKQLEEALAKLRHHALIYDSWGFAAVDRGGRAATLCLFGPPGTGKTRAAEALAGTIGAPFLAVAAGDVESRYMGDSAKNVKAIFAAAKQQQAVLFFDEADSLFGRRASEVTQGVDHEVNLTKSTLLVEVEQFTGLLILATNFQRNLDPAFRRRISWTVEFVKPDAEARRALWELHVPAQVPLAEPRAALIEAAVAASDGLAGGDVLTAMRIALGAVVHEAGAAGRLGSTHLAAACEQIRKAEASLRGGHRPSTVRELLVGAPAAATPDAPPAATISKEA